MVVIKLNRKTLNETIMKKDDFERLKAICEKEGFIIEHFNGLYAIKEIDHWEGVDFVECVKDNGHGYYKHGNIYRVDSLKNGKLSIFISNGNIFPNIKDYNDQEMPNCFKPSTETAYVDQLKKEAFERFGEIKEGQRMRFNERTFTIGEPEYYRPKGFYYDKKENNLFFYGHRIYHNGKWAERVKERAEITFVRSEYSGEDIYYFGFRHNTDGKFHHAGQFLASQLEKYLNGEVE